MDDLVFFVVVGIIQGILEWLPVSSSGNVTLVLVNIAHISFSEAVKISFFLHAGTMLSVLVKFRSDFFRLSRDALSFNRTHFLTFYVIATVISAGIGLPIYFLLTVEIPEYIGSFLIAIFLVVTGVVIRRHRTGLKPVIETRFSDAVIVGIAQGVAVIPGISRSGMVMTALLSRGVAQKDALHTSFLLSVPPVLALMVLGFSGFSLLYFISMAVSFVFSLLSMEILLKMAQKLDFSWFCFAVAGITVVIVAIQLI